MKLLVVGSGGREHAIIWKLSQSKKIDKIYCAPGNGGISDLAECVSIGAMEIDKMVDFAKLNKIDMVVVAPDDPLAAGMVDAMQEQGIRAFGPSKDAAIIEASKAFSKDLMKKYNIPTAEYENFTEMEEAFNYLKNQKYPIVVKADGLALGKGVLICENYNEACNAVKSIMEDKQFGEAGNKIVIEEFLTGPEVSVLSFCDGTTLVPMVSSQDHKRALDGDKGLNTGGMGTFTPSKIYTKEIADYCIEKIFKPTVEAMKKEGRTFKGVLYFGLILTPEGPKVLEYNARFGDPETQVVLPRLETDLIDIFDAVIDEKLNQIEVKWNEKSAVCVIMASGGYPKSYKKGFLINGVDDAEKNENVVVFHAGTKKENNKYYTNGGRVLGVTALEDTMEQAIKKAYEGANKISFEGAFYRKDIGVKAN